MRAMIQDDAGQLVGIIDIDRKDFATGSKGFFGVNKVTLNGKRYQGQVQLVEIKPKQGKD